MNLLDVSMATPPPCRSVRSLRKSESLSGQISESDMVLFSQVSVQIAISALVASRRFISSAFILTSDLQFVIITVSLGVCRRLGLNVRVLSTGGDIASGSPILLSAMLDELGVEKRLVCSDMVESKNDEEKLCMPQRQHCHETLFDARLS